MKIGIDARMYGPKQGGLGRYIQQLIAKLENIVTNDEVIIFLRKDNWEEFKPKNPNFKKVLANVNWYGWKEQIIMPKIIKKQKIDLMHFPHWNVPLFYNKPFVVTIHDLLLLHYPTREASTLGPLTYWLKNLIFKKVLRHAAQNSKHIIAVSEFTKNDIHQTLKIPLDKITVTYQTPFIEKSEIRNPKSETNSNIQNSKSKNSQLLPTPYSLLSLLNITKPYILYVGVAYPHKNLAGLLKAWKIFCSKYGNNYQLVLAGKENHFYRRLFNNRAMEQWNKSIVFTNFVPDADLPSLYQNASLYVMPSFYEGFALPSLEAMSYGVPVTSSNATCLPEVLKDATIYFNPTDVNEMAEAINKGLTDANLREKLLTNAQNLLKNYSWTKLAKETWGIYQNGV